MTIWKGTESGEFAKHRSSAHDAGDRFGTDLALFTSNWRHLAMLFSLAIALCIATNSAFGLTLQTSGPENLVIASSTGGIFTDSPNSTGWREITGNLHGGNPKPPSVSKIVASDRFIMVLRNDGVTFGCHQPCTGSWRKRDSLPEVSVAHGFYVYTVQAEPGSFTRLEVIEHERPLNESTKRSVGSFEPLQPWLRYAATQHRGGMVNGIFTSIVANSKYVIVNPLQAGWLLVWERKPDGTFGRSESFTQVPCCVNALAMSSGTLYAVADFLYRGNVVTKQFDLRPIGARPDDIAAGRVWLWRKYGNRLTQSMLPCDADACVERDVALPPGISLSHIAAF